MQNNDELIQRLSASMETLNGRIARLASALHVSLNDPVVVDALMSKRQMQTVVNERRRVNIDLVQVSISADRRQAHQHEELRGLLVLRYHMETISLNDNGLTVTRQAMVQAEEHLLRHGFKPGADGLDLDDFFNVN